jgi:hypothetical protein
MSFMNLNKYTLKCAQLFSTLAWLGIAYTWFRFSYKIIYNGEIYPVVPFGFCSVVTLILSFISLICSFPHVQITSPVTWLFLVWCALPFLIIVCLLDPLGIAGNHV